MNLQELNLSLARVLGIDVKHCTGFDVRVRVNEAPLVTVHKTMVDGTVFARSAKRFELVACDPEPMFDLDRECEAAMRRVQAGIEASARRAHAALRGSFRQHELERLRMVGGAP